jgi:predicted nucleotidyltransferase
MSADDLLQIRRREYEALLQQAQTALQTDQRIVAAWLFGSVGRRTADVYSDLDVWVIVKDECIELMSAERQSYAAHWSEHGPRGPGGVEDRPASPCSSH